MKIDDVTANDRHHEFSVVTRSGVTYAFPYEKADPFPGPKDRIVKVFVDKELGDEAFTYVLESGREGSVHIDHVLEYNEDPDYLAQLQAYKLSDSRKRDVGMRTEYDFSTSQRNPYTTKL